MNLLICLYIILITIFICSANKENNKRNKRTAYVLSSGWDELINSVNPTFNCFANGYFADIANGCQLYHVCESYGKTAKFRQYSFFCGNGTIFDQLSLTCARPEESVPCEAVQDFYYLNERIGDPKAVFLSEEDVDQSKLRAKKVILQEEVTLTKSKPVIAKSRSALRDDELAILDNK